MLKKITIIHLTFFFIISNVIGQKNAQYKFNFQIELGFSNLSGISKEIYFQGGLNACSSFEIQFGINKSNYLGLQAGIGSTRYFMDGLIDNGRLVANNLGFKQQDVGLIIYRLNIAYENSINNRLLLRVATGMNYYGLQTVSYKTQVNSQIFVDQTNLKLIKPISELGLFHNFGGKPNLLLGFVLKSNPFSKNFINGRPIDFNFALRYSFQKK